MESTPYDDIFTVNMTTPVQNNRKQVVAMAYIPDQKFDTVYEPDKAYDRGTLYPELDKPFLGDMPV